MPNFILDNQFSLVDLITLDNLNVSIFFFFKLHFIVCVCVCEHVTVYVPGPAWEDNLGELVLSFYPVGCRCEKCCIFLFLL